jgi:hypothetical protein
MTTSEVDVQQLVWRDKDEDVMVLWLSPRVRAGLKGAFDELRKANRQMTVAEFHSLIGQQLVALMTGSACVALDHDG